ncbi:hypothetical protein J6590_070692 [Homalodisca vitripennis]|nr:hypothetical protein J6590_070692 [Homalodisca vitripennis]
MQALVKSASGHEQSLESYQGCKPAESRARARAQPIDSASSAHEHDRPLQLSNINHQLPGSKG